MAQLNLFQTPARDRAKLAAPTPDADWLFDYSAVTDIAYRRGCAARKLSDLAIEVTGPQNHVAPKSVTLTAIQPGKWHPVPILKACSEANGRESFAVDMATAKPSNLGGLDEIRIARIVAADGIRPNLVRKSWYWKKNERPHDILVRRATAGEQTWALKMILQSADDVDLRWRTASYDWRRGARTLSDVGLLDVILGPRGGLVTAICTWTPLAYLPAPAPRKDTELNSDDDYALACLGAGLPV